MATKYVKAYKVFVPMDEAHELAEMERYSQINPVFRCYGGARKFHQGILTGQLNPDVFVEGTGDDCYDGAPLSDFVSCRWLDLVEKLDVPVLKETNGPD